MGKTRPPSEPRVVSVGDREESHSLNRKATDNAIHTSKYNVLTFLPLNLWEQFHRPANVYFLAIAILTSFPSISPIGPASSITPLVFVLAVSAIKDGIEDWHRHKTDREVNSRRVDAYLPEVEVTPDTQGHSEGWVRIKWSEVKLGDVLYIRNNEKIPSDILLLGSSEKGGVANIDTKDLDGETNLKRKEAFKRTRAQRQQDMRALKGYIVCEAPNKFLHLFDGTYSDQHPAQNPESLRAENLILRECQLRNTDWCIGVAVYTGYDTKIAMQNAGNKIGRKVSKIDRLMNIVVLLVFCFLLFVVALSTMGGAIFGSNNASGMWYLGPDAKESGGEAFLRFFTFIIVFNTMIPISLYVSLEIVRVFHAKFVDWDHGMYYKPLDRPANCRNSNLCDELGQIEYIFSDKTGTLTRNQMDFMKCCVAGQVYGYGLTEIGKAVLTRRGQPIPEDPPVPPGVTIMKGFNFRDPRLINGAWVDQEMHVVIDHFMHMLALCNDVLVGRDEENPSVPVYKAASPDEYCLVVAGRQFGFQLRSADESSKTMENALQDDPLRMEDYEVLNSFEFDSDRKRQSVILRFPNGAIIMYCKGADSVILERLSPASHFVEQTTQALDIFAQEGLRTLAFAMKQIPPEVYGEWFQRFKLASVATEGRAKLIDSLADEIERDLFLVGATAIEDKLQEGVPEAITTMQRGNLRIWILTGDKWDTAINIGFACSLLQNEFQMSKIRMLDKDGDRLRGKSREEQFDIQRKHVEVLVQCELVKAENWRKINKPYAVIIDGESLHFALENPIREKFRELGMHSKAVVCCRVSPDQKAQVVSVVNDRFATKKTTPQTDEQLEEARTFLKKRSEEMKEFKKSGKESKNVEDILLLEVNKKEKVFTTLGIGDGANDVKMIKQANIGVGIQGEEGMQASMSSDFSFGQFRFLTRLLFIHGRFNYQRVCGFLGYFFYKNITLTMTQLWFNFYAGFSGSVFHEAWHSSLFNVIFTSIPVLVYAIFDRDFLQEDTILKRAPELYEEGQKNSSFHPLKVIMWFVEAIYQSLVFFYIPVAAMAMDLPSTSNGRALGQWAVGSVTFTAVVVGVNLRLGLEGKIWTFWTHLFIWLSIASWFLFALVFDILPIGFLAALDSAGIFYTIYELFATANFYWSVILALVIGLAPAYIYYYVRRWILNPPTWCVFVECELDPSKWGTIAEEFVTSVQQERKAHEETDPTTVLLELPKLPEVDTLPKTASSRLRPSSMPATPPPLPTPISNSPNSNGQEMPLRSLSRGPSGFKGSGSHMNNTSSAASSSHSRLSSPSAAVRPTASLHNLRRSGGVMPSLDFSPSKPQ